MGRDFVVKYLIGIDPGYTGAIGILDGKGKFVAVYDMPVIEKETGKTKIVNLKRVKETKREVDGVGVRDILKPYKTNSKGIIEAVHAMPEQGVTSVFNFGCGYGVVLGVMQCLDLSPYKVPPNKWKSDLGLNSDKVLSIELALELFPEAKSQLTLKKHNGRAEALLIAFWSYHNDKKTK